MELRDNRRSVLVCNGVLGVFTNIQRPTVLHCTQESAAVLNNSRVLLPPCSGPLVLAWPASSQHLLITSASPAAALLVRPPSSRRRCRCMMFGSGTPALAGSRPLAAILSLLSFVSPSFSLSPISLCVFLTRRQLEVSAVESVCRT